MTTRRTTQEVEDERGHDVRTVDETTDNHPTRDAAVVSDRAVTSASPGGASVARRLMTSLALLVGVAAAAVTTLIGFRLAFLMTEANAANSFVNFIYDVTDPLVEPFQGIIANDTLNNGGILEPASIIAIAVYLLAAVFLIAVILVAASGMGPDRNTVVTTRSRESDRAIH
jgi:uncharacterized protein YggT (Ycf19 family)